MNCLWNDLYFRLQLRWYLLLTTMKGLQFISTTHCMISTKQILNGFQVLFHRVARNYIRQYANSMFRIIDISQIRTWAYYGVICKIFWQDVSQWHKNLSIISDVVLAHKSNVTLFVTFFNALCCYFHTLLFSTTVNLQFRRGKCSYYISGYVLCNIIIVRKSLS